MQGHIHRRVHTTNDGRTTTTWYVVVDRGRDRNGKRRQKWHGGFRTRREAEAARARIVNDINCGTYVAPTTRTLESFIRDEWLPVVESRLKPTTFDSYRRTLELHVLPSLGSLRLPDLTPSKLNALYADLLRSGRRNGCGGGLSARSVAYAHRILHKVLADAVDVQLLASNPATRAQPPRAMPSESSSSWTVEQLRKFLESTRDSELYALWHLAAMTGMRRGELLALRWGDVELDQGRVVVRRSFVTVGNKVRVSSPKSHRPRVVDIDEATCRLLADLRGSDDQLVFADENEPLHPDAVSKRFQREIRSGGLPRIRFHDLRHTHATIALRAGVPVNVVSARLGHESPAFTLRQYAHVLPGMQAEAAALVAGAIGLSVSDPTSTVERAFDLDLGDGR